MSPTRREPCCDWARLCVACLFEAACHVALIRPRVLGKAAHRRPDCIARTGYGIAIVPSPVRILRDQFASCRWFTAVWPIGRWAVGPGTRAGPGAVCGEFVTELVTHVDAVTGSDLVRRAAAAGRDPAAGRLIALYGQRRRLPAGFGARIIDRMRLP